MKGRELAAQALKEENVKHVFGLPGGHSLQILYDALYDVPEIRTILVRHEQSAPFMAYAYARLTGEPGICHGTCGPGTQNLVAGMAEAWAACMPVIAICPQVNTEYEGKGALQEFPAVDMFKPFTKWAYRVSRGDQIQWAIRRAFQIATTGKPGPVFLEIPVDKGEEQLQGRDYIRAIRGLRVRADEDKIGKILAMISQSKSPVIVAGGGVYLSGAFEELRLFAEALAIPVLTTASGKGSIPEDHPLSVGLIGIYRTAFSKDVWEQADLVVSIGCRFEEFESGRWFWFPKNAKYVQVDIDPFEIGRNWMPDLAVVSDAKLLLADLLRRVKEVRTKDGERIRRLAKARDEYYSIIESQASSRSELVKPLQVLRTLRKILDRGAIMVHENGLSDIWSYSQWPVFESGMCVMPASQTCMGLAVAGSIGAKIAMPSRQVACITGDGAFQMLMKELPTAVQYHAPVLWCIFDNSSLGFIKYLQKSFYGGRIASTDFEVQPDFVKIADACKCYGQQVSSYDEVESALKSAVNANKEGIPAVLDFKVELFDFAEGILEYNSSLRGKSREERTKQI